MQARDGIALHYPEQTSQDRTSFDDMHDAARQQDRIMTYVREQETLGLAAGTFVIAMYKTLVAEKIMGQREIVETIQAALRGR